MSAFTVTVILAGLIATAYSLNCYQCTNKCDDVSKAANIRCDSSNNVRYTCYKKVEKDKATSALNVTRGCYILRNDNDKTFCNIADPSKTENVFCEACQEDLCNSANNFSVEIGTITAFTFSVLAARFFAY